MNIAWTRAADGLARRAFSVDDIQRMMEAGILSEDERFELIEGDLVMMSAKHVAHDRIKHFLTMELVRAAEATLQLRRDILVESGHYGNLQVGLQRSPQHVCTAAR